MSLVILDWHRFNTKKNKVHNKTIINSYRISFSSIMTTNMTDKYIAYKLTDLNYIYDLGNSQNQYRISI